MQLGDGSTGFVKEIQTIILFFADYHTQTYGKRISSLFVPRTTVLDVLKTSTQIIIAPS